MTQRPLLLLAIVACALSYTQDSHCLRDAEQAVIDAYADAGPARRLRDLLANNDFKKYHEELRKLEVIFNQRRELTGVFFDDSESCREKFEAEIDVILQRIEAGTLSEKSENIQEALRSGMRRIFHGSGYYTLHMEDDVDIKPLWPAFFNERNRKFAQTSNWETAQFWIRNLDPATTKLFLDNDIAGAERGQGAGIRLVHEALALGFTKVHMVSGKDEKTLLGEGKPPHIRNLQKPGVYPSIAIDLIEKYEEAERAAGLIP